MDRTRDGRPTIEDLQELIGELKRIGVRPSPLSAVQSCVFDHPAIVGAALSPDRISRAYVLIQVLDEASHLLGDPEVNPRAEATRHLFGLSPDTRGRLLLYRRRIAADAMGLAVRSFTKDHENDIEVDLAAALHITLLKKQLEVA